MTKPAIPKVEIPPPDAAELLNALPHAMLAVAADGSIREANAAAEAFFELSRVILRRRRLVELLPFGSPLLPLVEQVRERGATINEYRVDLGTPRTGTERIVDIHAAPLPGAAQDVVILLQERTIADKMDRQLTHRGAARSVSAMAAMLAHEIKNPLSGIRGAAQLLESDADDGGRALTRLICEETDRIVKLVDRMEAFSDDRPIERSAINVHTVLDHVKRLAQAGFAKNIRFSEIYDPSLPLAYANRDQLIQVFLNLIKNAAEAVGVDRIEGEIELTTAFRAGVRMKTAVAGRPTGLPLEICVRDNGGGIAPEIEASLFEPFVSNKHSGSGLGLALVAKIIGDHGGIVEFDRQMRWTVFRILLPMYSAADGRGALSQ